MTPVVNPYSYGVQGQMSPESQAFMVEMYSAWRDWVSDGSQGQNAAGSIRLGNRLMWTVGAVGMLKLIS